MDALSDRSDERDLEVIAGNVRRVRASIDRAAARVGRRGDEVQLLAVTKYVSTRVVRLLHRVGVRDFGENTLQGTLAKRSVLEDLPGANWHLIGHLQRNKAARALSTFASIHSVDSLRLLVEIAARARGLEGALPALYIEVNVAREPQKTGLAPEDLDSVFRELPQAGGGVLAGRIVGLMGMAPYADEPERSRPYFRELRDLRDSLVGKGRLSRGAALSMGMSGDFEVAVEEGATVVRVGTSLFEGSCTD